MVCVPSARVLQLQTTPHLRVGNMQDVAAERGLRMRRRPRGWKPPQRGVSKGGERKASVHMSNENFCQNHRAMIGAARGGDA